MEARRIPRGCARHYHARSLIRARRPTGTRTYPSLVREGKTWRRLVDDEALIRSLLRRILEEDGHQIREADNGQIGLTLYREAPADVVITDILMPERDGMDVTLALTREF